MAFRSTSASVGCAIYLYLARAMADQPKQIDIPSGETLQIIPTVVQSIWRRTRLAIPERAGVGALRRAQARAPKTALQISIEALDLTLASSVANQILGRRRLTVVACCPPKTNSVPSCGSSKRIKRHSWLRPSIPLRKSTGWVATSTRMCGVICIMAAPGRPRSLPSDSDRLLLHGSLGLCRRRPPSHPGPLTGPVQETHSTR